jgi:predicted DNA-binding protein
MTRRLPLIDFRQQAERNTGAPLTDDQRSRSIDTTMSTIVSSLGMALERINLNVPPETRRRLRAVAKRLKKTESEVVRDLLAQALDRAEKDEFYREVARTMTPEMRRRMIEVAEALERIDG